MDLLFAVVGAVGFGCASVLQSIGARGGGGTLHTLAAPAYLAGLVLDLLAWLSSLVALRSLPVYEVQAILAASLAVTAALGAAVLGLRLRRQDVIAMAVTMAALVIIAAAAGPQHAVHLSGPAGWGLASTAIPVALAGWYAAAGKRAAVAGALAGIAFGGAALCARAIELPADPLGHLGHSLSLAVADPLVWALALFGATGMVLYASALEHGDVGPVTALLWIMEVVVPSAAGAVLLHDSVRPGWVPALLVAMAAAIGSAAVLASAPAQAAPHTEPSALTPSTP